jgi:hypothetical protein
MSRVILFNMLGSTMSSPQTPEITLNDVYAQVGRILFKWSHFERELNESTNWLETHVGSKDDNKTKHHGAFQVSNRWKTLNEPRMERDERHRSVVGKLDTMFSKVLLVRNALCHGQLNATGDPSKGKAFVKTELSGEEAVHHYSDLIATIDKIHCIQMVLMDISSLYTDLDNHSVDTVFKNVQGRFERVDNN